MYTEDEKQYLALRAQLEAELADISVQLNELALRRERLEAVLNGEVQSGEVDVEVEAESDFSEAEVNEAVDKTIAGFIEQDPGRSRSDIAEILGYSIEDVSRALSRMRRRGLIISEGRARAALWYPTEVK